METIPSMETQSDDGHELERARERIAMLEAACTEAHSLAAAGAAAAAGGVLTLALEGRWTPAPATAEPPTARRARELERNQVLTALSFMSTGEKAHGRMEAFYALNRAWHFVRDAQHVNGLAFVRGLAAQLAARAR